MIRALERQPIIFQLYIYVHHLQETCNYGCHINRFVFERGILNTAQENTTTSNECETCHIPLYLVKVNPQRHTPPEQPVAYRNKLSTLMSICIFKCTLWGLYVPILNLVFRQMHVQINLTWYNAVQQIMIQKSSIQQVYSITYIGQLCISAFGNSLRPSSICLKDPCSPFVLFDETPHETRCANCVPK